MEEPRQSWLALAKQHTKHCDTNGRAARLSQSFGRKENDNVISGQCASNTNTLGHRMLYATRSRQHRLSHRRTTKLCGASPLGQRVFPLVRALRGCNGLCVPLLKTSRTLLIASPHRLRSVGFFCARFQRPHDSSLIRRLA